MEANPAVRVDKFLWAVRLFKTRSLAAAACAGGKVLLNGSPVKPSRAVRVDDLISADNGTLVRTVKVKAPLEKRVGAAKVGEFVDDLTPPEEYDKAKRKAEPNPGYRAPGAGRPTKRDRRILQSFFGEGD